jgi:endonuclease YncB( thermonuclease family)
VISLPPSGVAPPPCQRAVTGSSPVRCVDLRARGASLVRMRMWVVALLAIALASLFAGGMVLGHRDPPAPPLAATAPLPPPAPVMPLQAAAPSPAAESSPQSLAPAPPPDLPTVEVAPRAVHTVPDQDTAPPRPVTMMERDGRNAGPRPAPVLPPQPPAATINGTARLGEGVSLIVRGREVDFFGVRAPKPGDRCTVSDRLAPRACGEVAREVLALRLNISGAVSCRLPPGQGGAGRSAICLDSTGVDLGGFLVAQGFALAEPAQSRDYVGAERVAASLHRGLWRFR